MERPQAVLVIVLALGVASTGFFYSKNQKSLLEKDHKKEVAKTERRHARELEKLRTKVPGELEKPEEQDAPPVGPTDLLPKEADTGSNTAEGQLQDQVVYLEEQLGLLRNENARLFKLVARLEVTLESAGVEGAGRIFSADEVVQEEKVRELTEKTRGLKFKQPVEIEFTNWEKLAEKVAADLRPKRTPEEHETQSRAYAAMGFVPPNTNVPAEITSLLTGQLGAATYVGDNKILFNKDGKLTSIHDRTSLAIAMSNALQDQHFDLSKLPAPTKNNDDPYTAADALLVGIEASMKSRHMLYDRAAPTDDLRNSPTALTQEDLAAVSPFIREYFLFPYSIGKKFGEHLQGQGKWDAVNASIQDPPGTTAEIFHPELYKSADFKVETYPWSPEQLEINGVAPIWNNVAGELGINIHLNRSYFKYEMYAQAFYDAELPLLSENDLRNDPGSVAAAGWRGDRYLVYPNGDGAGGSDHIYWRTKWATPDDAAEFFHGARVALAYKNSATLDREDYLIDSDPEGREPITAENTGPVYEFKTPNKRHLHIELNKETNEVIVIDAADETWLKALLELK